MKKISIKASTLIEVVVSLLIIIIGLTGIYNIFTRSQRMENSTENRIKAISIAKEGLEIIQNIRDTNWLKYGADTNNCWNTLNYDGNCIGTNSHSNKISGSYIVYRDSENKWMLESKSVGTNEDFKDSSYRDKFRIKIDNEGFYAQSGSQLKDFLPVFTREIKINNGTNGEINVQSLVQWQDSSKTTNSKLNLKLKLTNWKE